MRELIVGESKAVTDLRRLIERVAPSGANVLVTGESGTGKELVAKSIHEKGPLKGKSFVAVNCGAIPHTLIESEMFGHKRGSFTGAVQDKAGLFEVADGGTLFLDEIGEVPLAMQAKLLRAIQERQIRRVGGTEAITVNVRIISATNRDLESCVAKGTFREDLFYRLNVIQIRTPPLRERKGDVSLLVKHFIRARSEKSGVTAPAIDKETMRFLDLYRWPGNVRELENTVDRLLALAQGTILTPDCLPAEILRSGVPASDPQSASADAGAAEIRLPAPDFSKSRVDLEAVLSQIEHAYLVRALAHSGGVKTKAADLLGITLRSLRYRMKKVGLIESDGGDDAE